MHILLITATSVTYELENNDSYYTNNYELYLNNQKVININRNVYTIYNLIPNKEYTIKVVSDNETFSLSFKTLDQNIINLYPSEKEDNTKELQAAINSLKNNDLLRIHGQFKCIALFLKSDISIELCKDCTLIGENDRTLFPILKGEELLNGIPLGTWEGKSDDSFASIITGLGVSNVTIYGEGIIDCKAQDGDWWINHRVMRIARRPKGIFLHTSSNITFEGITVCNTPSWNQHPFYSKHLKYYNLKLLNPSNSPTTDGLDPESCTDVEIIGTRISVGDDCIAIKSGKIDFARKYKTPSSMITIKNCLMEYGHAGVTLGSENSAGINNVNVSNCLFKMTDRGLRIKSQRGRGNLAIIENINFDNIIMQDVKSPFVINAFYKAGNDTIDDRFDRQYQEATDLTPSFNKFSFKNIKCSDVSYGVGFFLGLPESPIKEVLLENVTIGFKEKSVAGEMAMTAWHEEFNHIGFVGENVESIILKNVHYENEPSEKFIIKNVKQIKEL